MRSGKWRFGKALALTGITTLLASSCGGGTSADVASNATYTPSSVPPSNSAPPSSTGATPGQAVTTVRSDLISLAFAYSYLYGQSPNPNATDAFDLSWSAYLTDLGTVAKDAKSIADTVSSIIGGFNAAVSVLQFLGLLPAPVDEVALLTKDVNAIGTGATWQSLHDYVDPKLSEVQTVAQIDIPEQGVSNVVTSGEDGAAAADVQDLFTYSAWHRVAIGSGNDSSTDKAIPHPGNVTLQLDNWKQVVAPAPIDAMNEVFEWRLGAPAVLSAIALRMTILGAINPNFATDPLYRTELQAMHDGLAQMYQTMLGGIQCKWGDYGYGPGSSTQGKLITVFACQIVCADIYSGISSLTAITPSSVNGSYNNKDGTCEAHVNTEAFADAVNQTNYNVRSKIPLFEMRSMIDLLETMLRGAPDLTQKYHRITPQSQQNLCVGTVGGSGNWGTNLQLTACNLADPSQYWTFNRTTGQISNPNLNVCIDERWGLSYGTDIGVWQCDTPHAPPDDPAAPPSQIDNLAQKWTFDPSSGQLRNGFGVAMAWLINPGSRVPSQGNLIVTEVVGQGGYDVPQLDFSFPTVNMAWHADGFTKGDGNGDGLTDVYLAGAGGGDIPVAENVGGGNFYCDAPPIDNTQFSDVWAMSPNVKVLTGDFNGDGLSDIALTGVSGWQSIPIAFKAGYGFHVTADTNSYVVNFAGWATWQNVWPVTGDFNGDGRTDIALVGSPGFTTLPIAISNGDGSFYTINNAISSTFYSYAAQPGARPVIGDFNGDGLSDIAIIGGTTTNLIPIALSNGDGTFTVQPWVVNSGDTNFTTYSTWAGVHAVSGDFNGDGKSDIAITGGSGWWGIPVAFSNGDGTFGGVVGPINWGDGNFATYASWPGVQAVSGDFNNDGKSDIALTGGSGWWTIPVAFSNGDGTWGVTNNSTQGLNFPGQAATPGVYAVAGGY
jgi:FG-GAP-like repeat/Ricin-type beta-trefoil lectin domain